MSSGRGMPARGAGTPSGDAADLRRRVDNIIRYGVIESVAYDPDLTARVRIGRNLTDWLPLAAHRAWGDKSIHPLEVGEQVIVLSPSGKMEQGVILPVAIYKQDIEKHPVHNHPNVHAVHYRDGTVWSHDREKHEWALDMTAQGTFRVTIGSSEFVMRDGSISLTVGSTSINLSASGITRKATSIRTYARSIEDNP